MGKSKVQSLGAATERARSPLYLQYSMYREQLRGLEGWNRESNAGHYAMSRLCKALYVINNILKLILFNWKPTTRGEVRNDVRSSV